MDLSGVSGRDRTRSASGARCLKGRWFTFQTFWTIRNTLSAKAEIGRFPHHSWRSDAARRRAGRRPCLTRSEARPFTDKQIELVTTFADQAAIAIENVRLFDEVQAKTRDLIEALIVPDRKRQYSQCDCILADRFGPVLKAIVESACELCEAYDAVLVLKVGDRPAFFSR